MKVYLFLPILCIFYGRTSALGTSPGTLYTNFFAWRAYNGSIPENAFPGGRNDKGYTYIGRVNTSREVLVAEIDPTTGVALFVSTAGVVSKSTSFEILIGPTIYWKWKTVNSKNFYDSLACSFGIVVGGNLDSNFYNIGRINVQNEIHVGGIASSFHDPKVLKFIHNNEVYQTNSYQVLVYEDDDFCPSGYAV